MLIMGMGHSEPTMLMSLGLAKVMTQLTAVTAFSETTASSVLSVAFLRTRKDLETSWGSWAPLLSN